MRGRRRSNSGRLGRSAQHAVVSTRCCAKEEEIDNRGVQPYWQKEAQAHMKAGSVMIARQPPLVFLHVCVYVCVCACVRVCVLCAVVWCVCARKEGCNLSILVRACIHVQLCLFLALLLPRVRAHSLYSPSRALSQVSLEEPLRMREEMEQVCFLCIILCAHIWI